MNGPIVPVVYHEELDRRAERLPCAWLQRSPSSSGAPTDPLGLPFFEDEVQLFLVGAQAQPRPQVLAALASAAQAGRRIYALAELAPQDLALGGAARVLVRRGSGVPCTGVLAPGSRRGALWIGHWLALSTAQVQALFAIFGHLFWSEAKEELFVGSAAPHKAAARAPDLALPGGDVTLHKAGERPAAVPGALWHAPDGKLPTDPAQLARLLVPPSGAQEALAVLRQGGCAVEWHELGLPPLWLGTQGALLLEGARHQVRVMLDAAQASALQQRVPAQGAWTLALDTPLGALPGKVWLPGATAAASPEVLVELDCGDVTAAALSTFAQTRPQQRPGAPVLAQKVRWRFRVLPPRAPHKAAPDPLRAQWQKLDEEVQRRRDQLRKELQDHAAQAGGLKQLFASLAAALLGLSRKREELMTALEALETPSKLGPEGARELLPRLEGLEREGKTLRERTQEEERRAREERERAEQRVTWEREVKEAREGLQEGKKLLAQEEGGLRDKEQALAQLREEEQADLPSKESGGAGRADAGEASQVGEKEETKEQKQESSDWASRSKDRKARRKKLQDEIDQHRKRIVQRKSEIAACEERMKQPFEFRPSVAAKLVPGGAAGPRFVPTTTVKPVPVVPDAALPQVGALLHHDKVRYLAIARWEELAQGEREAQRLQARLVTTAEGA